MAPSFLESTTITSQVSLTTTVYPRSGNFTLTPGFYVPTVAFFTASETLDLQTTSAHTTRLVQTGISGLVTHGSNGEAPHLSATERKSINSITRAAMDAAGKSYMPLIVGCGAQSTLETIQLCQDAASSGGQFALILPPSYYNSLLTIDMIEEYFLAVAEASPLPILIYNYPGATSGRDLDSDSIIRLSSHANIVGVKLTCGNTGKMARIVAGASAPFLTMGGSADFSLQTLVVGGHGIIGGLANLAPKACTKLLDLGFAGMWKGSQKEQEEMRRLQAVVARGDWVTINGGFVAVKVGLREYFGYGGWVRRPCRLPEIEGMKKIKESLRELLEFEESLT